MFASGAGTNFNAILNSIESGYLKSRVTLLVTNNTDSGSSVTAKKNNIGIFHTDKKSIQNLTEEEYCIKLLNVLKENNTEFIVLSGYMQMVHSDIIKNYRNRIINIHPSLLPSFGGKGMYGLNVHKAVINAGVKVSGITIHFVNESYDEGGIIFQKCTEVNENDNEFTLQEKVRKLEHEYYSYVIKKFEDGKVSVSGSRVTVK